MALFTWTLDFQKLHPRSQKQVKHNFWKLNFPVTASKMLRIFHEQVDNKYHGNTTKYCDQKKNSIRLDQKQKKQLFINRIS